MANYVVDASIVIEYLITGPYTPHAQAFFSQIEDDDKLDVPEFCLLECTNVIWKQARFGNMSGEIAGELLTELRKLKLRRAPMKRLLDETLTIALDNKIAVYDASYIALAKRSAYPLISIDRQQIRAALAEGVSVIPLTDFKSR
jgi:predicted nucleic acid-binding protein